MTFEYHINSTHEVDETDYCFLPGAGQFRHDFLLYSLLFSHSKLCVLNSLIPAMYEKEQYLRCSMLPERGRHGKGKDMTGNGTCQYSVYCIVYRMVELEILSSSYTTQHNRTVLL